MTDNELANWSAAHIRGEVLWEVAQAVRRVLEELDKARRELETARKGKSSPV